MNNRTKIRLITFITAIALVLIVQNICLMKRADNAELALGYGYLRAMEDLSTSADNISVGLEKSLYSNDSKMLEELSNSMSRDAATAKSCLSQLPLGELELEDTYKFFSQVGNFSTSIAKKLAEGTKLTDKEYDSLQSLYKFSVELKDKLWQAEKSINNGGTLTYESIASVSEKSFDTENAGSGNGFEELDSTFDNYPTLIYDGPYSDHLLVKSPELIKGKALVTKDKARERAAQISCMQAKELTYYSTEQSSMPAYIFKGTDTVCAITVNGGYCSYMLKSRLVSESKILNEEAVRYAEAYLGELGIEDMATTYFEAYNNTLIVNFAYQKDGIIYYPDLIKVSIALDNGEILGFDARGYIANHCERKIPSDQITEAEATEKISPKLDVKKIGKALIPTGTGSEIFCYEFLAKGENDADVLVYINCETGAEEQILILIENENGTLTV